MHVLSYDPPDNLGLCIAVPEIEPPQRKTALARKVLPDNVPLRQVTHNVGHAASLVYGMLTRDVHIIGSAMNDGIVEPIRSKFVPGYENVKAGALKEGAAGVVICGAGPSLAAFYDTNQTDPQHISERMVSGFKEAGIESNVIFTAPGRGIERVTKAGA
jgi:homoserine kinase